MVELNSNGYPIEKAVDFAVMRRSQTLTDEQKDSLTELFAIAQKVLPPCDSIDAPPARLFAPTGTHCLCCGTKLGAGVIMSSDKTVVFTPRGIDPKSMSISRECPNCYAKHTAYDVTTPTGQRLATKEHMSRKGAIVTQRTMYDNALLRECIIDIFSS